MRTSLHDRSSAQLAYFRTINRFVWAVAFGATAWLIVLCMKGAVLLYEAPASILDAAYWLSWVTYPPAALETVVGALLLVAFRPKEGADRIVVYAAPDRLRKARWMIYAIVVTPLPFAFAWIA